MAFVRPVINNDEESEVCQHFLLQSYIIFISSQATSPFRGLLMTTGHIVFYRTSHISLFTQDVHYAGPGSFLESAAEVEGGGGGEDDPGPGWMVPPS